APVLKERYLGTSFLTKGNRYPLFNFSLSKIPMTDWLAQASIANIEGLICRVMDNTTEPFGINSVAELLIASSVMLNSESITGKFAISPEFNQLNLPDSQ